MCVQFIWKSTRPFLIPFYFFLRLKKLLACLIIFGLIQIQASDFFWNLFLLFFSFFAKCTFFFTNLLTYWKYFLYICWLVSALISLNLRPYFLKTQSFYCQILKNFLQRTCYRLVTFVLFFPYILIFKMRFFFQNSKCLILLEIAMPCNFRKDFYKFPILLQYSRIFYVEISNYRFYYLQ